MSVTIDKSEAIRKSKWNLELSAEQSLYAATDAYVSAFLCNLASCLRYYFLKFSIFIISGILGHIQQVESKTSFSFINPLPSSIIQ